MGFVVAERAGARLVLRARELRGDQTLTAVAESAGIRQDDLGKIERGETQSIKFETLLRLCRAFNVTPGELFELEQAAPVQDTPLAQVLAAVDAGKVTPHTPPIRRRRLTNADVEQDLTAAAELRAEPDLLRRRTRVPATGL